MNRHLKQRQQVAETALSLLQTGLVVNTSGNASIRIDDEVVITPSGRDYDTLKADDICVINMAGELTQGRYLPSSETPLHLAVYQSRPEISAIVHTHSVHATAVSTLVQKLPAIHYQMTELGGAVPVAPYATFGTPELAASVLGVLSGRTAALMQNHGSITIAATLQAALAKAITLEWCCKVWLKAVTAGEPSTLSDAQMKAAEQQMEAIAQQRKKLEARQD